MRRVEALELEIFHDSIPSFRVAWDMGCEDGPRLVTIPDDFEFPHENNYYEDLAEWMKCR